MKRAYLALMIGALLLPGPAGAQPQPTNAPAEEPKGPPQQQLLSAGTLPDDLLGRWLVVGWISINESDKVKTTTALWEVTREDAQLVFRELHRDLPASTVKAINEANTVDKAWRPTPQDLTDIASSWGTLPERDPQLELLRNELYGPDGYDADFKNEAKTKDAIWAARQTGTFRRSAQPAVRSINVFGAIEARDGGYAGNYTAATIAAAPFPIPITLQGKFQMYRVGESEPPATGGFLSSLFSGCGRK